MHKFKYTVRMCLIYAAVVLLAGGYPMTAMADTADTTPPVPVAAPVADPAPAAPTSPVPAPQPEKYTYNPDTKHWDSNKWVFNPTSGKYEPVIAPPVVAPAPTVGNVTPTPATAATKLPDTSATTTVNTNAAINNNINSDATTGNSGVTTNTSAGNAATGSAAAVATVMNTINSSVNAGANGGQFATFVTNVVGDVHGDIMLYPMLLAAMLHAATNPSDSAVAVNNNSTITNNLNLNATSGNAAVTANTTAGNATTGTANTVANVMNIINSIIAANKSFMGTVNIYGNLDGDILVAPDFLPQLLASNNGNSSAPANSLTVSSQDTQSIVNNINLNAASGNAVVAGNTSAGNATTGKAMTNLVLLNLSGHQIVASNSMLVFVNVLGQWVGMIVDAPAGTTAAALGDGVTTNTVTPNLSIDVNNNSKIVNNLNLNSQSGNATVADNTKAGNATTGNATASANVANVTGSQLGLSGWFGVLFINVFGSWLGSFGIDTAHGNPVTPAASGGSTSQPTGGATAPGPFQFIARTTRSTVGSIPFFAGANSGNDQQAAAASTDATPEAKAATTVTTTPYTPSPTSSGKASSGFDFLPFTAATFMLGLGGIATKNIITAIRGRKH